MTQSEASSGQLPGSFSPLEHLSAENEIIQRRSHGKNPETDCVNVTLPLNVDHHSRNSTNVEIANVSQDTKL